MRLNLACVIPWVSWLRMIGFKGGFQHLHWQPTVLVVAQFFPSTCVPAFPLWLGSTNHCLAFTQFDLSKHHGTTFKLKCKADRRSMLIDWDGHDDIGLDSAVALVQTEGS